MRRWWLKALIFLLLMMIVLVSSWGFWAETHPEQERDLRNSAQDQLLEWFPDSMTLPADQIGFQKRTGDVDATVPDVILIHGLDEPGGIWDETLNAMADEGIVAWEFLYPNDQAINYSADLLAKHWLTLDSSEAVILVGHSMGGLVIRDFVTRWRHPVEETNLIQGPSVLGVIQIGTPNQGSGWARLRAWLEVREWISHIPEGEISPFVSLRQGTGAAKIDLRPDSEFLKGLNARKWPQQVKLSIIGGILSEPSTAMLEGLDQLAEELEITDLRQRVEGWWAETGEDIGDGVVPVTSLRFDGAPEPILLPASHRGLLMSYPLTLGSPPAIPPLLTIIKTWLDFQ